MAEPLNPLLGEYARLYPETVRSDDEVILFDDPELTNVEFFNYLWYISHPNGRYRTDLEAANALIEDIADYLCADLYCKWARNADVDIDDDLAKRIKEVFDASKHLFEPLPVFSLDHDPNEEHYYFDNDGEQIGKWLSGRVWNAAYKHESRAHCSGIGNSFIWMSGELEEHPRPMFKDSGWKGLRREIAYEISGPIRCIEEGVISITLMPTSIYEYDDISYEYDFPVGTKVHLDEIAAGLGMNMPVLPVIVSYANNDFEEQYREITTCRWMEILPADAENVLMVGFYGGQHTSDDLADALIKSPDNISVVAVQDNQWMEAITRSAKWAELLVGAVRFNEIDIGWKFDSLMPSARFVLAFDSDVPRSAETLIREYSFQYALSSLQSFINRGHFSDWENMDEKALFEELSFGYFSAPRYLYDLDIDKTNRYASLYFTAQRAKNKDVFYNATKEAEEVSALYRIYSSIPKLKDVLLDEYIWQSGYGVAEDNTEITFKQFLDMAEDAGVVPMIEAYARGLPIDDICA